MVSADREPFASVVGVVGFVVAAWGIVMALYGLVVPTGTHVVAQPPVVTSIPTPKPVVTTDLVAPVPTDPATVVLNFVIAINRHQYQKAWELGGRHFAPSLPEFVAGCAHVDRIAVTIEGTDGDTVTVALTVHDTSGVWHSYNGTYVVANGMIQSGTAAWPIR